LVDDQDSYPSLVLTITISEPYQPVAETLAQELRKIYQHNRVDLDGTTLTLSFLDTPKADRYRRLPATLISTLKKQLDTLMGKEPAGFPEPLERAPTSPPATLTTPLTEATQTEGSPFPKKRYHLPTWYFDETSIESVNPQETLLTYHEQQYKLGDPRCPYHEIHLPENPAEIILGHLTISETACSTHEEFQAFQDTLARGNVRNYGQCIKSTKKDSLSFEVESTQARPVLKLHPRKHGARVYGFFVEDGRGVVTLPNGEKKVARIVEFNTREEAKAAHRTGGSHARYGEGTPEENLSIPLALGKM
jgi:hypothetical protein